MDDWQELEEMIKAEKSEWERTVIENQALQKDLQILCQSYDLPKKSLWDAVEWMDKETEKYFEFQAKLTEIAEKHGVNKKWFNALHSKAAWGQYTPHFGAGGVSLAGSTDSPTKIVLDPNAPISNRYVQESIKRYQKILREPISKPQPSKENPRKLDWRPVKEWSMRHPEVTQKEMAKELGCNVEYLGRKLRSTKT